MATILDILQTENVAVDASAVNWGPNTDSDRFRPENWVPWKEFNYKTLLSIYGDLLGTSWTGSRRSERASAFDTEIFSEDMFEDILRRFVSPTINDALRVACSAIGRDTVHLGRGSRCEPGPFRPDWSLVARSRMGDNGRYANLLPGDTKLHRKWYPEILQSSYDEWRKPVSQVMTYMMFHESRYGFIITDGNLVVFRITRERTGAGSAAARAQRQRVAIGHQRLDSDGSDVSMASLASLASLSMSDTSFRDNDPLSWEYHEPEYAVIPWAASGRCLTVKLALWWLCMMATGDTSIDEEYPPLDSWVKLAKGYVHNTTGEKSKRLPRGATIWEPMGAPESTQSQQEPQGSGAQLEDWQQQGSAGWYEDQAQDVIYVGQRDNTWQDYPDEGADGMQTPRAVMDDDQTNPDPVPDSEARGKKKVRDVKLTKVGRGKYAFNNSKGSLVQTTKEDWEKTDGGYEYSGGKHVYFAEKLP